MSALLLGAGVTHATTPTCATLTVGSGCNPVVTDGQDNTAMGTSALFYDSTGSNMVAVGTRSLYNVNLVAAAPATSVAGNVAALGYEALNGSLSGVANIGVGPYAGRNIIQGQLNTDIGSWGSADESNTIRIGLPQYHLHTYVAGIATTQLTGAQVVVTSSGQLGVLASSERYKTDIHPLAVATDRLSQLLPVSFHLKSEPDGVIQYGLIAEEVDKVYPELVIRDGEGNIQGVRYDELAPMLLSEMQNDRTAAAAQAAKIDSQAAEIASLRQQLAEVVDLKAELAAIVGELKGKGKVVAQR